MRQKASYTKPPVTAQRAKVEAEVTSTEIRREIGTIAPAKSPGPDLLTGEFYQTFIDLVCEPLTEVLNEAHYFHTLPETTTQGIIKIMYKKGDPRDLRNYRPLTMLNTDYREWRPVVRWGRLGMRGHRWVGVAALSQPYNTIQYNTHFVHPRRL